MASTPAQASDAASVARSPGKVAGPLPPHAYLPRQRGLPLPRPGVRRAALRRLDVLGWPGCESRAPLWCSPPGGDRGDCSRASLERALGPCCPGHRPRSHERLVLSGDRPAAAQHGRGHRVPGAHRARCHWCAHPSQPPGSGAGCGRGVPADQRAPRRPASRLRPGLCERRPFRPLHRSGASDRPAGRKARGSTDWEPRC